MLFDTEMSDCACVRVRFAPFGTILRLFKISFLFILLTEPEWTVNWSLKFPDQSKLVIWWPHYRSTLTWLLECVCGEGQEVRGDTCQINLLPGREIGQFKGEYPKSLHQCQVSCTVNNGGLIHYIQSLSFTTSILIVPVFIEWQIHINGNI